MQILLLNHYAGSLQYGMEYRPYYLAREWVRAGHRVTVVAASYSHLRIRQPKVERNFVEEKVDGIRYIWLRTPEYEGNGLRRAWNMAAFVWRLWRHETDILRENRPDVVIASSPHPFLIFPARRIAKQFGARLIFEVRDLWPLTLMELNGMSRWHPFIRFMQFTEDYAYRHADRVVSLLPSADDYMREHGLTAEKFACVPNGICVEDWLQGRESLPKEHAAVLRELQQAGRFIVGYVGGHQPSNALDTLLETASMLRDASVAFVLMGQGSQKEHLQRRAVELALKNVVFLPPIPKACVPNAMDAMDVLYLGLKNQPIFRYGISPNKLVDYMMAAKPVIHAVTCSNDMVAKSNCGLSCPGENADAIRNAIVQLMNIPAADRANMGERGQQYVLRYHDYSVLADEFIRVMAETDTTPATT